MGIIGMFKDLVGLEEEDDEDITEEEIQAASNQIEKRSGESKNSFTAPKPESNEPKLIAMQNKPLVSGTVPINLVVIEPRGFEECQKLVDDLKTKKPVIINLEKIETDVARKIFDFLSGAVYALNGNVQKIANNIFVFTPENVSISGNMEGKSVAEVSATPKKLFK